MAQEAKLVNALGPALQRAGLHTKILGYDHNWSEHPNDIAVDAAGRGSRDQLPVSTCSARAPATGFAGTAFHCYAGDQARQTELHNAFPDKEIWFTECSGSHGPTDPPAQVFSDTLKWHARNLVLGVTRNWAQTVVNWNLALDPSGGPHNGGCDTLHRRADGRSRADRDPRRRVLHARPSGPVRAARRGAHRQHVVRHDRLERADHGRRIPQSRRLHRAGRRTTRTTTRRTFAVAQGDASFDYTLPGGALATFVWPASRALDDGLRLLACRAQRSRRRRPSGADAANAVDDDAITRWTTGAAQQPGQTLQVDLGSVVAARRLVLDTGPDTSDYPRGYAVSTSVDGTTWSVPLTGSGTGQLTNIALPGDPARYVRVVQTGTAAQWWTVADLRVYR